MIWTRAHRGQWRHWEKGAGHGADRQQDRRPEKGHDDECVCRLNISIYHFYLQTIHSENLKSKKTSTETVRSQAGHITCVTLITWNIFQQWYKNKLFLLKYQVTSQMSHSLLKQM